MEFEKAKPATAQQVALADAPLMTVQPVHADVRPDVPNTNYTHQNEAVFEFESETTDQAAFRAGTAHPHHMTGIIVAATTASLFGGILLIAVSLR